MTPEEKTKRPIWEKWNNAYFEFEKPPTPCPYLFIKISMIDDIKFRYDCDRPGQELCMNTENWCPLRGTAPEYTLKIRPDGTVKRF